MGRHLRGLWALLVAAALGTSAAGAQTLDAAAKREVIDTLLARLDALYVFPETAAAMGSDIRARLDRGEYADVAGTEAFATRLTADLQAVSHDRHLRVRGQPFAPPAGPASTGAPDPANAFGRVELLDGNIGYVEIRSFGFPAAAVRERVRDAMTTVADADILIVDLRSNGGGNPGFVALVSSYLFDDEPVHLNSLYFRPTDQTTDYFTDPDVEGRRFGGSKPVYVLTSARTFSAAEEFTYNLQARKRATIVGETTGGGAHPGGVRPLPHGMAVFVPSGRAINPITGTNWEGSGITPDIDVPADQALDAVLRRVRRTAQ